MPTGYTAGILDGEITTFKQFALLCMRNFGATIHMRDEPLAKPYQNREPSDYHIKRIEDAKELIKNTQNLSDEEILKNERERILRDRQYHLKSIEKNNKNLKLLNKILKEVNQFTPPTKDHEGLKSFMISQIKGTIDFDCSNKYHEKALAKLNPENLDANILRAELMEGAYKELKYHTKEHREELARCKSSNQWVKALTDSIKELERKSTT